ncbi:hypothetical protein XELAEV_18019922mg [Xenopus laevis]|uniref:Uncharacterized protein n=1 Tax=Xenopus laevis TaxID=8355 RepID=A0A974D7T0_XENLA|nr:hypothetical protein XELAEV_18019922mg [Xenopus laevis]
MVLTPTSIKPVGPGDVDPIVSCDVYIHVYTMVKGHLDKSLWAWSRVIRMNHLGSLWEPPLNLMLIGVLQDIKSRT